MIYRPKNSFDKRRSWNGFLAASFVLALVVTANSLDQRVLPNILYRIGAPLWRFERSLGESMYSLMSYFQSKYALQIENTSLKTNLSDLKNRLAGVQQLEKENESLKNLLGRDTTNKAILGVVLSSPPFSPYDTLVIDVGSNDGVAVGNIVEAAGGVAVGDISEVYPSYSKVSLFSSPGREVPVLISDNKIEALARGVGSGSFEIILPREIRVKNGDSIILPNIKNMLYGTVNSVETSDADFLQLITFSSPINIFELRYVAVMPSDVNPANVNKNNR